MSRLRPTEEQLDAIAAHVFEGGDWSAANRAERAEEFKRLRPYWNVIRDMVLEAAAKEVEEKGEELFRLFGVIGNTTVIRTTWIEAAEANPRA